MKLQRLPKRAKPIEKDKPKNVEVSGRYATEGHIDETPKSMSVAQEKELNDAFNLNQNEFFEDADGEIRVIPKAAKGFDKLTEAEQIAELTKRIGSFEKMIMSDLQLIRKEFNEAVSKRFGAIEEKIKLKQNRK